MDGLISIFTVIAFSLCVILLNIMMIKLKIDRPKIAKIAKGFFYACSIIGFCVAWYFTIWHLIEYGF